MPLLTDKQRRAVDRNHESRRNETRNEIMRQALNVVNREYFGMPSDDRQSLPQRLATHSGQKNEYIKRMNEIQDDIDEAMEGIGRLRGEMRIHNLISRDEHDYDWWVRETNLTSEHDAYMHWYHELSAQQNTMRNFAHAQEELRRTRRIDL